MAASAADSVPPVNALSVTALSLPNTWPVSLTPSVPCRQHTPPDSASHELIL
jgi:hypothetical protein